MLALNNINYKASIIGILMMLAFKNSDYKASVIGILIMLALKNIKNKASSRIYNKLICLPFDKTFCTSQIESLVLITLEVLSTDRK